MDVQQLRDKLHPEREKELTLKDKVRKHGVAIQVAFFTFLFIVIFVSCSILQTPKKTEGTPQACFKHDVCIDLIVVTTPEAQEIGLSNYTSLPQGIGMLFIFPKEDIQRMWMNDMKFNIDLMWIDKNRKIVHIEKNAYPCVPPQCEIFEPTTIAKYVLETNTGFALDTNLFDNDNVEFKNLPSIGI
jgi:uncharacterized membrane protein (UPF0127 family)